MTKTRASSPSHRHSNIWTPSLLSVNGTAGTDAPTVGRVYLNPIVIYVRTTINAITYQKGAGAAGNVRVGIYADNGDTPVGGALLLDNGDVAVSAGTWQNQLINLTNPITLDPGLYWIALEFSNAATRFVYVDGYHSIQMPFSCYYTLGAYGAFTNPCPAVLYDVANTMPIIFWVKGVSTI